jgi:TolB-like protein
LSLIAELKRRNVFKVGLAYLALAWVMVQATGAIVPALNLPATLVPTVVWIGIIGFPCVLVFSWVYELTPEGLKRESEIDRSQSITYLTGKRLDTLIIVLLVVAMLMFAADRFIPRAATPLADASSTVEAGQARDETGSSVGAGHARDSSVDASQAPGRGHGPLLQEEAPAPDAKSIAVLPFVDMSQAKDQEYFSDGIAEELLNLLAKIPELKVAARTSSFSYKGSNTRIAQIGQELNVAHLLEGSVRKAGNTLRITAQLVRSADGYHLWSETYDRPLDDIFAVQDEIAGSVVEQLKIKLLGAAPTVRRVDPEAYALYLRAVQQDRLYTNDGMELSFELYQQALAIEPAYAAAWLGVAGRHFDLAFLGRGPLSADENVRLAREAAGKAIAIDPAFAPAHAFLGMIADLYDNDPATAARQIEQALVLDPSHPLVLGQVNRMLITLGRLEEAIELGERGVELDPIFGGSHSWVGWIYARAGRLDEAIARYRTALLLNPDAIEDHYQLGVTLLHRGEKEAALEAIQAEEDEGWRLTGLAVVYHALGRKAESDAALDELTEKHQKSWSSSIAWVHAYRGDADAAFEWMDTAVANHDMGVVHFPVELLLASLHTDPRWLPFLRKIGRAPEQLAAIPFEVKLPHK